MSKSSTSDPAASSSDSDPRGRVLRLAVVGAAAGVLLALVFGLGSLIGNNAEPIPPDNPLGDWRHISHAQKEATARRLLEIWKEDGTVSPRVAAQLADPNEQQQLVDELVAGLDLANNHDTPKYIPPSVTIRLTGREIVKTQGWDK